MLRVPAEVLSRLQLDVAAEQEALDIQPLLPPVPGMEHVAADRARFVRWLHGQLQAGMPTARGLIINVPKPTHGNRPAAVWGVAERVVYRSLVNLLISQCDRSVERQPDAYRIFVNAPILFAEQLGSDTIPVADPFVPPWPAHAKIKYVVKADIAAYYEYIDHDILGRELLVRTGDNSTIETLLDILSEVQGRRYGLPQLQDPSDQLAELYADVVERAMLRRGWPAWRFNDDFRIAVTSFVDAKLAIEDLAACARDAGLTLNEAKTKTPTLTRYFHEDFVPDYTEDPEEISLSEALLVVQAATGPDIGASEEGSADVQRQLTVQDQRQLRRAFNRLSHDAGRNALEAVAYVAQIVRYAPALTPWVMRYLTSLADTDPDAAGDVAARLTTEISLSSWQRIWLIRTLSRLGLTAPPTTGTPTVLIEWVRNHRGWSHDAAVRSEATLALATGHGIEWSELVRAIHEEPSALAPWYLSALRQIFEAAQVTPEVYAAVRDEGGLNATWLRDL